MIFSAFDPYQVVAVSVDPRIREQEFGNLQGVDGHHIGLRFLTRASSLAVYRSIAHTKTREVTTSSAFVKRAQRSEDFGSLEKLQSRRMHAV